MSSTKVSTKPCLDEARPETSRGWDDAGLIEAAFEGRLSVPLHVPGTASQIPVVRLVEPSQSGESPGDPVRARLVRALGFLVVVLGTLLLADLLS